MILNKAKYKCDLCGIETEHRKECMFGARGFLCVDDTPRTLYFDICHDCYYQDESHQSWRNKIIELLHSFIRT